METIDSYISVKVLAIRKSLIVIRLALYTKSESNWWEFFGRELCYHYITGAVKAQSLYPYLTTYVNRFLSLNNLTLLASHPYLNAAALRP